MKWLIIPISMLIIAATIVSVNAQGNNWEQENYGAEELSDGLSGNAKALMQDFSPLEQADFFQGLLAVFEDAAYMSKGLSGQALHAALRLLAILILCKLSGTIYENKRIAAMTGALAIITCCASNLRAMIGLGQSTMEEISNFLMLLLPVMMSAATAAGSVTGAGSNYVITSSFSSILIHLCKGLLIPLVYTYLALALADCVLQQDQLKRIRELLGQVIAWGLKGLVYLFIGCLTICGVVSSNADTAALKAAKFAISGVVPVVGGMISDTAATLLSGAQLIKNAVGTFGMLAVISIFVLPFIQMGISYLSFRVISALGSIFQSDHLALLDALSAAMGYMLAMTASGTLISLISCIGFLKAVSI